ncbi:hypothetical protein EBZ37_09830 [bacterium]|nr:hypothetical protein [bacterium]
MRKLIPFHAIALAVALPLFCRADAQEVARVLGTVHAKPVRPPYTFEASERVVVGQTPNRVDRFFSASLELEAEQRGYFVRVPDYRVQFALETIRARFAPRGDYEALRLAISSRTQQPGLLFELNWKAPLPFDAVQAESLNRQIAISPSKWTPSLLSWIELPKTQLNDQYLSNTRIRVLQEILAQETPNCFRGVSSPSIRELTEEFEATREKWILQRTGIDFVTVRFPSKDLASQFISQALLAQQTELDQFNAASQTAKRSEWNRFRAELIKKLQATSPKAKWTQKRILWPLKNPNDLQGLDPRQLDYALKAPLGSVLLPAVLEGNEIWIVAGESREPPEQLSLENSDVYAAVRRTVQNRLLASCAKNWFAEFIKSRISLRDADSISKEEMDLFFKSLGERGPS